MEKQVDKLELIEFLNRYLPFISTHIPTGINDGGCGVFASLLYKALLPFGLVSKILMRYTKDRAHFAQTLKDYIAGILPVDKVEVGHIILKLVPEIYCESDGLLSTMVEGDATFVEMTIEQLDALIAEVSLWNVEFDRDTIPQLQAGLDAMVTEFDQWKNGKTEYPLLKEIRVTPYSAKMRKLHHDSEIGIFGAITRILDETSE